MTLVMLAVKYHEEKPHMAGVTRALLAGGSDPDRGSPLQLALVQGNYSMANVLLDYSARHVLGGQRLLHQVALGHGDDTEKLQMAERLVGMEPALVTELDERQRQPIHLFCRRPLGDASCQGRLLELLYSTGGGRVVDAKDNHESSPLHCAAEAVRSDKATIPWLCERGGAARINDRDGRRSTPLKLAARNVYHIDDGMLRTMMKYGAVPTLRDSPDLIPHPYHSEGVSRMCSAYRRFLDTELAPLVKETINDALLSARSIARVLESLDSPLPADPGSPPPPFPINDPVLAWRIASFLVDSRPVDLHFPVQDGECPLARRLNPIVSYFVGSAASLDVIADEGQVDQLARECFVVGSVSGRRVCLDDIVQRAMREEGRRFGLRVVKGCSVVPFAWGHLGVVKRCGARWEGQRFVPIWCE
mmetsp:Transcript_39108/g.111759  ORF Transcript_39108/g.111759 Transcript_39108/m.111759 type:complete len:418 (+) Transcript_39108:114-1367(+)